MKYLRLLGGLAAAALSLSAATPALADVVPNPPDACPDGAKPSTCHGGPYCATFDCATSADCGEGLECKKTKLCTDEIDCGGGNGPSFTFNVQGACGDACAGTCTEHLVCVKKASTGTGTGGSGGDGGSGAGGGDLVVTGCSCNTAGSALGGAAGAAMLLAGVLGLAGRRSRRRR